MQSIEARRLQVCFEARRWIDTPYRHQGRLLGHAIDCAGVVVEVGLELNLFRIDRAGWADAFRPWSGYGRLPHPTRMRACLSFFLDPIEPEEAGTGDVAWCRWSHGPPMHTAIRSDWGMIHAHAGVGRCVEHDFSGGWPDRVVQWFRYPRLMA